MLANTSMSSFFSFLFISVFLLPVSSLNQEGLSLLSWLSTVNSSASSFFFSSWDPTHQNPCKWTFITCSTNGSVSEIKIKSINLSTNFPSQLLHFSSLTTLVISNANITGEIPSSIANLLSLCVLDLSSNALVGKIPPEIGKLSRLRFLNLNSNLLQGRIPTEIGNCLELRQLELVDNQFSGKVPAELGRLSFLETFRAGGNPGIHGEIPAEISNCRGLVFLGLAATAVSGQIPPSLGRLKNLRTVAIYNANLSGVIPPELTNCSALENLFLYQNQISGGFPSDMGLLKNLNSILLWNNALKGTVPESLGNCTSLTILDLSLNYLTGEIPLFLSNLIMLEVFLLSNNNISGHIPPFIGNFSRLKQLELDNNRFHGEIPAEIGHLKELTQFFAWQNQLNGNIPTELGRCKNLQALDLSYNFLTGPLPSSLLNLRNLNKVMLISNGLSGSIPPDIGNCTGLIRLRLGLNRFTGVIPSEIGLLHRLSFLELSENSLSGEIPHEIGNCRQLEMVDLHENRLQGMIPASFEHLTILNELDISSNRISGTVPEGLGMLRNLNKLALNRNYITGLIPKSLGHCKDLQSLDMSSNRLSGLIPDEIGNLQELDILLNLSWNYLSGPVPRGFSNLSKLGNLDISHNMLTGTLLVLGELANLVSLDVSYNNFTGSLPNTVFFRDLPTAALLGNQGLCTSGSECFLEFDSTAHPNKRIILSLVFSVALIAMVTVLGVVLAVRARKMTSKRKKEEEKGSDWEFTLFQKLDFSVEDILMKLSDSNIIGKGSSGLVYQIETRSGQVIAVKKLWPDKRTLETLERDAFTVEVSILGSIRHKNIVRLLGCCSNRRSNTRLLLFDYISNGSLDGLLHERKILLNWDSRYKLVLGVAQGLAYLHHDCIPPIVHRDIKANNILVGPQFDAYLADFGLAKPLDYPDNTISSEIVAGSYGYIAPEYGYSLKITEKSDVYSYGVLLLEILTGVSSIAAEVTGDTHIVEWVRKKLNITDCEVVTLLDEVLQKQFASDAQEMLQVLGVALLCVRQYPEERPTMKDVAALLKEIRHEPRDPGDGKTNGKMFEFSSKAAHCSSFSRASETLMGCPSWMDSLVSFRKSTEQLIV